MPQPNLAAAVDRVLAPSLATAGFAVTDASDSVVTLVGDRVALRLSYNREDLPRAWLSVTVGRNDARGTLPAFVALWRAFPEEEELQGPESMRFGTDEELEQRVVRVRDDWFPRFIAPAFATETRIPTALLEQEGELLSEHEALEREQHLRNARSLFDAEDYERAAAAFVLLGVETLSAADRRRLALARRGLNDGRAT
jgi:hypothetical protein